MSEARPFAFPRLEPAAATPDWVEASNNAGQIRTLVSHLSGEEPEPAPALRADSIPQHAPEPEAPHFDVPIDEQRLLGRLPGPPSLGSLIPGGRSNPPPANDAGHATLIERADAFANAALELAIARAATLAVLEGQLLDLAVEIASAIIEHEVESTPELHAALARAALGSLGDSTHVTLRTSPDGFATICASLGGEEIDVRGVRVQVVADPSIPGLGCVVDGDSVRVDATVSERLRAVRRAFEDERRKSMENVE
jgi:vacuolar-type H+-ATPase subunit E/Vma4